MPTVAVDRIQEWVGRRESVEDTVTPAACARMAATLDCEFDSMSGGAALPPLWHWIFCTSATPTAMIGIDGHPQKGSFLPPVSLPRRMWAGSRIDYSTPIRIGDELRRDSEILSIKEKADGDMVFVTVQHSYHATGSLRLSEQQDIVYRRPQRPSAAKPDSFSAPADAQWSHQVLPDNVRLFRYSALTFNAHRIHYDRDYATSEEGYPALIVHGPLMATMLMQSLLNEHPAFRTADLSVRALKPLFDTDAFSLNGRLDAGVATLWVTDSEGNSCLQVIADAS